jgi:hypothetical protein
VARRGGSMKHITATMAFDQLGRARGENDKITSKRQAWTKRNDK